ncbi:MAG: tetratricopeptide repeat protein [Elusimicrobiota bacterium]|nr:tetratricopeptide repeat protein [Elusimicrobiota bacterium]
MKDKNKQKSTPPINSAPRPVHQFSHSSSLLRQPAVRQDFISFFLPTLFAILLLLNPLFPDVQITRPKLMIIELGVYLLALVWILKMLYSSEIKIRNTNLNLPILTYIVYIFAAYLLSTNKSVAISEFKRMILCSAIFFLTVNIITEKNSRNIVICGFIVGSTLATIYGLLQHWGNIVIFRWTISVPQVGRVMSTFGNPIFFAAHLVIFLPVVLGMILYVVTGKKKKFWLWRFTIFIILIGIFLATLAAIYFTKTRAAWIGLAVSIVIFGIINLGSKKMKITFISISAVTFIVFVIITWQVWLRHQAHPVIWRDTLNMWLHYPVFGTGHGTFHINFPRYASPQLLKIWPQKAAIINDAHNEYIQILSETGIVGFAIFVAILLGFFKHGLKLRTELFQSDPRSSYIVAGSISSVAGIIVQNFFSVDMRFIISAFYMFLVMGILYSYETKYYKYKFQLSKSIRHTLLILTLLIFGIIGFDKSPAVHIASLVHLNLAKNKIIFEPQSSGTGLLPQILKPYIAQKKLSQEVDFFDEKVLEPYKTIAELEKLANMSSDEFKKQMKITADQERVARAKIYEKLAWVYAKEKNFIKAIENYENAIRLNPNIPGPFNNLGNIFFLQGMRQKAIECYKKSIEIDPKQIDARTNLGIAYYYEGKLNEAAEEFNKVLQLDPSNEKAIVMLKRMRE